MDFMSYFTIGLTLAILVYVACIVTAVKCDPVEYRRSVSATWGMSIIPFLLTLFAWPVAIPLALVLIPLACWAKRITDPKKG